MVATGVNVAVAVAVGVAVAVDVAVAVGVNVAVGVKVAVGVGVANEITPVLVIGSGVTIIGSTPVIDVIPPAAGLDQMYE